MSDPPRFDAWPVRQAAEALLLVAAAREAGLLRLVGRERDEVEIAAQSGLDRRAVSICLRALEQLGVVRRGARGFRLTDFGRSRFTDPASPAYVGDGLALWRSSLRGWLFLEDVLRTGRCLPQDASLEYRAALYGALDAKPPARVDRLVERILARSSMPRPHVLDVGGGSGAYARGFLARGCRVTLLDRPETIEHVRAAFGLDDLGALELVAGDFGSELPGGPFQAVLLAEVIHELSPAEAGRLLRRAARVCDPAAVIAIADLFRGRSARAALFAVTLLLYTEGGDVYSVEEVVEWLRAGGFEDPLVEELDADQALLTARLAPAGRRRSG